jgi:hypothetical protein
VVRNRSIVQVPGGADGALVTLVVENSDTEEYKIETEGHFELEQALLAAEQASRPRRNVSNRVAIDLNPVVYEPEEEGTEDEMGEEEEEGV